MYNYEWPEKPSFASSYACRFLPRNGRSQFNNVLLSPIFNLFDVQRTTVWAFSVALLIGTWYLLDRIVPICFLNSVDGQYVDSTRVIISTIILYFVLSAFLISMLGERGCSQLEEQARSYLYDRAPPIPATLVDSANLLKSRSRDDS